MPASIQSVPASAGCACQSGCGEPSPLEVARAAAVWLDCGVLPGETVAIRLGECLESLVAGLGATSLGGVPVVVDPLLPAGEFERLWSQSRWRFILADSRAEQPAALRDFILTRAEWRLALAQASPLGSGWAGSEAP